MNILPHEKENLHHAYFFTFQNRRETLPEFLDDIEHGLNISIHGNPDLIVWDYEKFSIEHARDLKELVLSKPIETRIIILSVGHILNEAQNALLKIFEDPPTRTHFFIIAETSSFLLPTLASRLSLFTQKHKGNKKYEKEVATFIDAPIPDKMEIAAKISEEGNESVRQFLGEVEQLLSQDVSKHKDVLGEIIDAQEFLLLPSAHKKGLLESIALSISK